MTRPQPAGAAPDPSTPPNAATNPTGHAEPTTEQAAQPRSAAAATPTAALDPALDQLVRAAKADLASRRGVAADTIELVEARSITWPDPSLGCPQPGMAYKQVPVDGVLIRLSVNGTIFNYHGGSRAPFLCDQPAPDTAPTQPGFNQ